MTVQRAQYMPPDREEVWDNFAQADKHMVYGQDPLLWPILPLSR